MQDDASSPARRRRLAFLALALAIAGVTAGVVAAMLPAGRRPMPDVVWIRGAESVMDRVVVPTDVRIGTSDGPAFVQARVVSRWSGGWSPSSAEGISFSRVPTQAERRQRRFAQMGLVPRYRSYGAGYEWTGRRTETDGDVWREFRKFDDEFNYWQIGWWPW